MPFKAVWWKYGIMEQGKNPLSRGHATGEVDGGAIHFGKNPPMECNLLDSSQGHLVERYGW